MLALRLPEEIERRLAELARRTGRTKSYYAREAILIHLEDLEDAYLAERRAEEFRVSGASGVPVDQVMAQYGVQD
ncbi:MAG: type II toxin-antitoxin system RelB family antitoxin [Egibacteraceae bacterium]